MNSDSRHSHSIIRPDAFLPLALLSISLILIFIWQLSTISSQRSAFQSTIQRQEELVSQSHKVQEGLEKLVNDLLDLAQTDEESKAIVQKYGIARNANPQAPTP